ncbi:MAG: ParB N-terminal domain-containing protein [Pseudomonadota bacterium]
MSDPNADPVLRRVPLDAVDPHALPRDRTCLLAAELDDLSASLRRSGLRQPVEIYALPEPSGPHLYGLISGYRRFTAWGRLRDDHDRRVALHAEDAAQRAAEGAPPRPAPPVENPFARIPAFLRPAPDAVDGLAAVVEENEQRQQLSPYERGHVVASAVQQGLFDTHEAAIRALHPGADRHKRARLMALAEIAESLGPLLVDPERLSQRQCLRLAACLRMGFEPAIRAALTESEHATPADQWRKIEAYLAESEARDPDAPAPTPGRPRRVLHARKRLTFRRERTDDGWCIHVTGLQATSDLCDSIFDRIEAIFDPQAGRR